MSNPYTIQTDVKYAPLEVIDLEDVVATNKQDWFNQTLCTVNDCVLRVGVLKGEFHWHKHDDEDEVFFVIEGTLRIWLEGREVDLGPGQGFMVPKGVLHKTSAKERVVVLMIEGNTVTPTGD